MIRLIPAASPPSTKTPGFGRVFIGPVSLKSMRAGGSRKTAAAWGARQPWERVQLCLAPVVQSSIRRDRRIHFPAIHATDNLKPCCSLEFVLELFDCKTGIPHNPRHREGVDRIVSRNGNETHAVRHHDVLSSFSNDTEPTFPQRANRPAVIDSRNLGHERLDRDFNLAEFRFPVGL